MPVWSSSSGPAAATWGTTFQEDVLMATDAGMLHKLDMTKRANQGGIFAPKCSVSARGECGHCESELRDYLKHGLDQEH